jgi:hypothetical protein
MILASLKRVRGILPTLASKRKPSITALILASCIRLVSKTLYFHRNHVPRASMNFALGSPPSDQEDMNDKNTVRILISHSRQVSL